MRSSDWLPDQEPSSAPRRLSNCPPKEEVTEIAFKCLRNFDHTLGDVTSPAITSFGRSHSEATSGWALHWVIPAWAVFHDG